MIDYGVAPAADEIEVTLFGPGYGEAIAVHLGEGAWLLVDSCIDPESKAPASGTYLEQIGIDAGQVRAIVASHWHDDHVRGISQLAAKYPKADFVISAVFNNKEPERPGRLWRGVVFGTGTRGQGVVRGRAGAGDRVPGAAPDQRFGGHTKCAAGEGNGRVTSACGV